MKSEETNESAIGQSTTPSPGRQPRPPSNGDRPLTFGSLVERRRPEQLTAVRLERFGRTVYVRQPTAAIELMAQAMMIRDGAIAHDRLAESRAWRMAQCLCDREGARLVGDDQLDQLLGLSKADFEELDNAIDRAISMEDVLGNSAATQS